MLQPQSQYGFTLTLPTGCLNGSVRAPSGFFAGNVATTPSRSRLGNIPFLCRRFLLGIAHLQQLFFAFQSSRHRCCLCPAAHLALPDLCLDDALSGTISDAVTVRWHGLTVFSGSFDSQRTLTVTVEEETAHRYVIVVTQP